MERLDKILAHLGEGSRKEVRQYIRKGYVRVDEKTILDPGFKIDAENVKIEIGGRTLRYSEYIYLMLNKPSGVISASSDHFHETVLDYIEKKDRRRDLFPVGRLDKDTEGLLILTNDGPLAHKLLSPRRGVPKKYYFKTLEEMEPDSLEPLSEGVDLGDFVATALSVKVLGANEAELVIDEGKFHQVKRMCAYLGYTIVYLERTEFGPLKLDRKLKRGSYRCLSEEEIESLRGVVK